MIYRIKNAVIAVLILLCAQAGAASLSDIQVSNGEQQARITLSFIGEPEYAYSQDGKRTVALDIRQTGVIQGLPLQFSGNNLVKTIRAGTPKDAQSLRLLVDLTENGKTEAVKRQNGGNYTVIFTINADVPPPPPPVVAKRVESAPRPTEPARNPFKSSDDRLTGVTSSNTVTRPAARASAGAGDKVVIAIDAGHGGQDPGAIGPGGTREKNVTIAIARKLRTLLNNDPMFKGVLTRDGDYFISVMGRSAVARKQNANFLVSIHADAFTSRQPSGSSVFALSTKGATSTAAKYLAQTQNASDLIGGVSKSGDRYVDHTMFDMVQSLTIADSLKFGKAVLKQLGKINDLHKNKVEQAGFAVLKAPDIPSILVETAFISNIEEERKLKTATFQQQVAESILAGIKAYFADGATLARRS